MVEVKVGVNWKWFFFYFKFFGYKANLDDVGMRVCVYAFICLRRCVFVLMVFVDVHINQNSEIFLENPFAGYEISSVLNRSSSDTVQSNEYYSNYKKSQII